MTDVLRLVYAAVHYAAGLTGGRLPAELAELPNEHLRRIAQAAARLVGAAAEVPHEPRHAAEPLD